MHDISPWLHKHSYTHGHEHEHERRTLYVVGIASVMMVVEIIGGWLFNSMAVLADGWHMSTHALALGVGAAAYRFARTQSGNPAYSFGTGKVQALGSFASAVLLALVALMVFGQSAWRLWQPEAIHYDEALLVATLGLLVNAVSALLLQGAHAHDHNLRAAYAHVITDALTSVLAIIALTLGKYLGWQRVDPAVGIVGALIIGQWAYSLIRATAGVLLDRQPNPAITGQIRSLLESDGDTQVADLHVWHVAPGRLAIIVSVVAHATRDSEYYKTQLSGFDFAHVTVEVNQCREHA